MKGISERQWSGKKGCVETVREFTYLADRVSAGEGCKAAATVGTICGWVKFMECGEWLYGRFPLRLKGAVYESYVRPAMLYGSETWCLREREMGVLRRTETHGERDVWSTTQW